MSITTIVRQSSPQNYTRFNADAYHERGRTSHFQPSFKRLVHFGNRVGKTRVTDNIFNADERDGDTQCTVVSGRAEGQGGSVSSLRLPMAFEEVDEEACIGGGRYYNMSSTPHEKMKKKMKQIWDGLVA